MTDTAATDLDERYPEQAKLSKVSALSQGIYDFLEFARSEGVDFGRTVVERVAVFEGTEDVTVVAPVEGEQLRKLMAKHFAIDLGALRAEKEQMIADMRSMNTPKGR